VGRPVTIIVGPNSIQIDSIQMPYILSFKLLIINNWTTPFFSALHSVKGQRLILHLVLDYYFDLYGHVGKYSEISSFFCMESKWCSYNSTARPDG